MIRLIDALPNDKIKKVETAKKETEFTERQLNLLFQKLLMYI